MPYIEVIVGTCIALLGLAIGGVVAVRANQRQKAYERQCRDVEKEMLARGQELERSAEARRKELEIEGRQAAIELREQIEEEYRRERSELNRMERRLEQKESGLDKRVADLDAQKKQLDGRETALSERDEELKQVLATQRQELERISGLSAQEARQILLKAIEEQTRLEAAKMVRDIEEETREEASKRARHIISHAIQKCAVDQVAESTIAVVPLPNDDMKGRIIGREGRNIRAFEALTGVDLIIDDTPEAVVVSGFDPVRREVARTALTALITDGRIHPGRIEEIIEKAQNEVEERMREAAEGAMIATGITGLPAEIRQLLGKLKFRTSYGQNVLDHSIECAHLAGAMAAELGLNPVLAKRAALLHDIGKATDYQAEGSHAEIGYEVAKRHHEPPEVLNSIMAHHGEQDFTCLEAVLVQAADAISASRPGARRESLESYIRRLERLERIADTFQGVEKAFAIQAGREIRVVVKPEQIDDLQASQMARDMAKRIEEELEYPGQIRVTVIRETRTVEYAK